MMITPIRPRKPLPPLPPTWRATITLGNWRERELRRGELLPCEKDEAA